MLGKKEAVLVLMVFPIFIQISLAQEQCLIVNEENIDESATRIWNTFSNFGLDAALSAVDSLKPGDNGYLFKNELKEAIIRISSRIIIKRGNYEIDLPNDLILSEEMKEMIFR